jgi:hypothetical protein
VDRDGVIAALVAVLFIHLLVVWLTPRNAYLPEPVKMPERQMVSVELVPKMPEVEDEPDYVRTNPMANNDTPTETTNYSTQDQVSAQEEVTPLSDDNLPAVDGEIEDSNAIVEGSPYSQPPMPTAQNTPNNQNQQAPQPQIAAPNQPRNMPRPDLFEDEPDIEEDGIASMLDPEDNPEEVEDPDDLAEINPVEKPSPDDGTGEAERNLPQRPSPAPNPQTQQPRPRQSVQQPDNSNSILRKNFTGVSRSGKLAIDARYSQFGEYWNRTLEAIELKWNSLVRNSYRSITFDGSSVTIEFTLTRKGEIVGLRVLQSGVGRLPETLAIDAIQSPSPFDEWTPEMISQMGTETVKQITFHYR